MSKILVIDDNKGMLDALNAALTILGNEVKCSLHAAEALEKLDTFMPDLILLDLLLSGENGGDVCRSLKANERTKHLPVIMMSAHPSAERAIFASGADNFLPKPFSLEHLDTLIKKHV